MSDESATPPENSATSSEAGKSPRGRRTSTPRPKKVAKSAPTPPVAVESASQVAKFPEFPEASEAPSSRSDWPEPEAASSGDSSSPEKTKRKRRRKKGKGHAVQNAAPQVEEESNAQAADEASESPSPQAKAQPVRLHQAPHSKHDAEMLAKCAWKIYLAEISEEGVALVGDHDAKELSRRCFRLAEIFMEEQARRR
jgi:hypothetical protein